MPEWTYLRKNAPVYWYDRPNVDPFWAITKHADIVEVARQPKIFLNGPRLLVATKDQYMEGGDMLFRHLLNMDPPEHANYRDLVNRRFTPRAVRSLQREVEEITDAAMDELAETHRNGGSMIECDFVTDVSAKVPLDVIAALLGVPKEDRPQLFRWTNETIGSGDPEFNQGNTPQENPSSARAKGCSPTSATWWSSGGRRQGRLDQRAGRGAAQRATAAAVRDAVVLPPAGGRRQRDHPQRDFRWRPGTHRQSRAMEDAAE